MTKANPMAVRRTSKQPVAAAPPKDEQALDLIPGKSRGYTLAANEVDPAGRHAAIGKAANAMFFGSTERGAFVDQVDATNAVLNAAASGDLTSMNRLLAAQALTLDQVFTTMMARSQNNLAEYPEAADRYARLAFKAQAQSRATIETLARIVQPREQTVRHIHVGPDGQAVFIENYNGGMGNARFDGRGHATIEASSAGDGPALLSQDAGGNGLPIPGSQRQEAMPHARRGGRKRGPAGE